MNDPVEYGPAIEPLKLRQGMSDLSVRIEHVLCAIEKAGIPFDLLTQQGLVDITEAMSQMLFTEDDE